MRAGGEAGPARGASAVLAQAERERDVPLKVLLSREPRDSERMKFRVAQMLGEQCDDRVKAKVCKVVGAALLEVEEGRPEVFASLAELGRRKRGADAETMIVDVRFRGALYRRLLLVARRSGATAACVVRGAFLWILRDEKPGKT